MVAGSVWLWGACVVAGGACIEYDEIWSMSRRYASYWNAFLFSFFFLKEMPKSLKIGLYSIFSKISKDQTTKGCEPISRRFSVEYI